MLTVVFNVYFEMSFYVTLSAEQSRRTEKMACRRLVFTVNSMGIA